MYHIEIDFHPFILCVAMLMNTKKKIEKNVQLIEDISNTYKLNLSQSMGNILAESLMCLQTKIIFVYQTVSRQCSPTAHKCYIKLVYWTEWR